MSGSGFTTVPGTAGAFERAAPHVPVIGLLVCVWNDLQPYRVGEVLPLDFTKAAEWLLGRDNPHPALLHSLRMRPGSTIDCGPMTGAGNEVIPGISRDQARFREGRMRGAEVKNTGRSEFLVNEQKLAPGSWLPLEPGDVLSVAGHSSFLYTFGPASMPASDRIDVTHLYGAADASGRVGESATAWDLRMQIADAVLARGHVIIEGQTGTGKEATARDVHRLSGRTGRFVPFNCAGLVDTIAEAQLFGVLARALQAGTREMPGLFPQAHGGTLFLDEFDQLPKETQAKLLRAMQNGEYWRVGEGSPRYADVLIVAATNKPLVLIADDVLARFKYRIEVASLASRAQDIPLIARHLVLTEAQTNPTLAARFLDDSHDGTHVRMAQPFVVAMVRASYPGNVRDLERHLAKAMLDSKGHTIEEIPGEWLRSAGPASPSPPVIARPGPDDTEPNPAVEAEELLNGYTQPSSEEDEYPRERILEALIKARWNQTRAALALGMSRHRLGRLIEKLKLREPEPEPGAKPTPDPGQDG